MRPAPAHIPLQELNDLRLTGIGIRLQQTNAAHDHSRSAVSALERSRIQKSLLYGMQAAIFLKTFDSRDGFSGSRANRNLARAPRRSPQQHGARATLPFPTAVLRPGQTEFIAQHVQERRFGRVVDWISLAVNFNFDGHRHSPPRKKFCAESAFVTSTQRLGAGLTSVAPLALGKINQL